MRVAVFSTKPYDQRYLGAAAAAAGHRLDFFEAKLSIETAPLAVGYGAVCAFVHDELDADVLRALADGGTGLVALRAAGFNNVDLATAAELGISIGRVPAYSPYAVAEHAEWVWIWTGDAEEADTSRIPAYPWFVREGWKARTGHLYVKCNYKFIIDNLLNMAHLPYVHPRTIGSEGAKVLLRRFVPTP